MAGGATQHAGGNMTIAFSKWDFLSQNETRAKEEQKPTYRTEPNFQSQNETKEGKNEGFPEGRNFPFPL